MTASRRVRLSLILALSVVVILAATLGLRLYSNARLDRALARLEQVGGGLDYKALAPKRVEPRKENAAFWLRTGIDLLSSDPSQLVTRRLENLGSLWTEADTAAFLELRAENEEALALMGRAATLERSSLEIEYGRGAQAAIPNFVPFMHASRWLAVECDFHHQRGETPEALAALHLLERLASVQRAEPILISRLTGAATERMYLDRLEAMLQTTRDVDTLRDFMRDLDRLDAGLPGARVLTAEVVASYEGILRLAPLAQRATGLDRLRAALFVETGTRAVESVSRPTTAMTPEQYDREVLRVSSLPPGLGTFARQIVPNYRSAIQREQWTRDARALARLAVELSLSRAGHGAYPTALPSLPVGSATGETATYAVLPDGGVEIAFPKAESTWTRELERTNLRPGVITTATRNLRWRLPP